MNKKKIGKFIAQCRKAKGLTQFQLAEQLGISDRAVSKWETGASVPDNELALELCQLLGININDLFAGEKVDCCAENNDCCERKKHGLRM